MDDPEIVFHRSYDDSMADPNTSSTNLPEILLDLTVVDEVNVTPSVSNTLQHPNHNVEQTIERNFVKVWQQIEDMFKEAREDMNAKTQRAIAKVDQELSALRSQLQNVSSPKTGTEVGGQNSHSAFETTGICSGGTDPTTFYGRSTSSTLANGFREQEFLPNQNTSSLFVTPQNYDLYGSSNRNATYDFTNSGHSVCNRAQNNDSRGNMNPPRHHNGPSNVVHSNSNQEPSRSMLDHSRTSVSSVRIKPQYYDGTEDLDEYLSQFEILSELNNWNYEIKSLYLASSLKGDARTLLTELSQTERRDFQSLERILNIRFGSLNRAEIYKATLQTRVKRRDESISELAQSIKKLTRQAYHDAPASVISTLARDHFIDALPESEMRLRIREAQVKDIAEAEILALRLEAYRVADRQKTNRNRSQSVNQVHSNGPGVVDNSDSHTLIKSIMDGFRQEMKSFSNDIKQVVKTTHDTQPTKANNNVRQNLSNSNNGGQYGRSYQNREQNNGQRNGYDQNRNTGYINQNNRNNGRHRTPPPVQKAQGNQNISNTGASVRQMNQGPLPY